MYSVPSGDISDKDVDQLLASLENASEKELFDYISSLLNPQNVENLIFKLNLSVERIPPEESKKLAIALSWSGNKFPNPQQIFSFSSPFGRGAMLIVHLIENLKIETERVTLAEQIIRVGQPISFSAEIIRWLRKDQTRYPNSISEYDWTKLAKILAERISEQVSEGFSF